MTKKTIRRQSNGDSFQSFEIILSPLFAAFAPFLVWLIEYLLPYPAIIEEVAKALLVSLILNLKQKSTKLKLVLLMGVLFTFSETVLYIFNISQTGTFTFPFLRLLLTGTLHTVTMILMLLSTYINKKYLVVAVVLTIIIHHLFNSLVGSVVF